MKQRKTIFVSALTALLLTAGSGCSRATLSNTSSEDTLPAVKKAIQDRAFRIRVTQMYPQNRRSISLTTYFSLALRHDSVYSDLPYFGEAYTAQMPNNKGLVFKGPVKELEFTDGKKGETVISFQARNQEDNYTYTITLWNNGSTDIQVQALRRQSISYHGELEEETK